MNRVETVFGNFTAPTRSQAISYIGSLCEAVLYILFLVTRMATVMRLDWCKPSHLFAQFLGYTANSMPARKLHNIDYDFTMFY